MVVCDDCGTTTQMPAGYCRHCGTELDRGMRDYASGFLTDSTKLHIQRAKLDDEEIPPRTHELLQANVREALSDFQLLDSWEDFDNEAALTGDISANDSSTGEGEEELAERYIDIVGPFLFVLEGLGTDGFINVAKIALAAYELDDPAAVENISVTFDVEISEE